MQRGGRLLVLGGVAALAGCGAADRSPPRAAHPVRVMSMNQCTDQLVLALLPPERIASVSWLARDPGGSLLAVRARRVGINHGLTEEVIAQRPDLVVAGSFTTPALRGMLRRLSYPLVEVDHADDVAGIRRITRQVAAAVGERARGEALIARMDRDLAALARDPGPPLPVVAWDRSGFAAGEGTLFDVILRTAGARSLVREPPGIGYRRPDVEMLLQADPELLVRGAPGRGAALGDDVTHHRVTRLRWSGRTLAVPQGYYVCGTPLIAHAALRLRDGLRGAAGRMR